MKIDELMVGDWTICCDYAPIQIIGITTNMYKMSNGDIRPFNMVDDNHNIRLWTIQDAKDGDVLYSLDSNRPFIYKERNGYEQAIAYCGINIYGKFFVSGTKDCIITLDKYVPATKEQCDLLFQKMHEAGYEWDADKKKLGKLVIDDGKAEMDYCFTKMMNGEKINPAWSEGDEEKLNQLHKLNNLLNLESIVSKLRIKNICDNINEPQYRIGYNNALKDIKYEIDQIPLENKNDIELENNIELIKKHYSTLSHIKLSLIDIEHCAKYFYKLGLKSQIKLLKLNY